MKKLNIEATHHNGYSWEGICELENWAKEPFQNDYVSSYALKMLAGLNVRCAVSVKYIPDLKT